MPKHLPVGLVAIANRQRGIVTRGQLIEHGVTDRRIGAELTALRWRRVGCGLYALFTGELTVLQRRWIAVLAAGPGAMLSHGTAAMIHRLTDDEPDVIHVIVPRSRRRLVPGVVVTRSDVERVVLSSPPTTSVADTLCDLAETDATRDQLAGAIGRAVQRRMLSRGELDRAIARRGSGHRRAAVVAALVSDAFAGTHSALEARYLREVERRHGLPRARRQQWARHGGRTTCRDVVYEPFGVVVELDGRLGHEGLRDRFRDLTRDQLARSAGEITVRFGWSDVAGSPCVVAAQVADLLLASGWTGRPRRCRRCGAFPTPGGRENSTPRVV